MHLKFPAAPSGAILHFPALNNTPGTMLRLIFCARSVLFRGSQTLCDQVPLPEPLPTGGTHEFPFESELETVTQRKIKPRSISAFTKTLCLHILPADIQDL